MTGDDALAGSDNRAASPRFGRRTFLKAAGAAAVTGVAAPALSGTPAWASASARSARAAAPATPLRHVIIDCQENRSFDHYYGFAPFADAAGIGVPAGYSQPDGASGSVAPFEFTSLSTPDIGHSWDAVHSEWNGGKMDGFYTTDGINCMGYYTAAELPYYYSLFDEFTLCGNYFCSVRGPTWPNRFYVAAGTSGGITTNGVWGYGAGPRQSRLTVRDRLQCLAGQRAWRSRGLDVQAGLVVLDGEQCAFRPARYSAWERCASIASALMTAPLMSMRLSSAVNIRAVSLAGARRVGRRPWQA